MLSNHTLVPVDNVQDGLDSSGISVHESTQTDLNMKRMEVSHNNYNYHGRIYQKLSRKYFVTF